MHTILPFISTVFIAISAILVAIGWRLIVQGKREQHRKVMLAGAAFALAFFIVYVTRSAVAGNVAFGGPDYLKLPYFIFLITHIILSAVAAVFGIITIRLAFKKNFTKHRKIGRYTATIWLITSVSGIMVYLLLYVIYPTGDVGNIVDAIFG